MSKIAELRDVVKTYQRGDGQVVALDNVDLDVEEGTLTAVVGPSGSGKTSLLNVIGALDTPDSGEVVVADEHVEDMDEAALTAFRRETVGFVFQTFGLIPTLTARENVGLPLRYNGVDADTARDRSIELLDAVGLRDRVSHHPGELSGGEQQRVAIARAFANDPALVLADEPTGQLDSKTGEEIVDLLHLFANEEGKSVLVVTHDEQLLDHADTAYRLEDGSITK